MQDPYKLAKKFFQGLCTQEEAEAFLKWYFSGQGEEEIRQKINIFRSSIQAKHKKHWDPNAVFEKIQSAKKQSSLFVSHKTDEDSKKPEEKTVEITFKEKPGNLPGASGKWRYAVACCIALTILVLGVLAYKSTLRENRAIVSPEYINKSNPAGQKSTIFLKDGSQIILNSASRLRYLARFPAHERVIEVYGEAFFEVAKDAGRPFRVLANGAEIIVYGTSFNVRSFADEKEIRVGLVEGKLAVKERTDEGDPVILFPGEGVIYYPHLKEKIVKVDIDIEKLIAWKTGILLFEDEPIEEVLKTLERWYGVEFITEGKPEGIFTGKFKNQSLEAVLEGIAYSFSMDYTINGKYVRLTAK